jgi:hypothetical protein
LSEKLGDYRRTSYGGFFKFHLGAEPFGYPTCRVAFFSFFDKSKYIIKAQKGRNP